MMPQVIYLMVAFILEALGKQRLPMMSPDGKRERRASDSTVSPSQECGSELRDPSDCRDFVPVIH